MTVGVAYQDWEDRGIQVWCEKQVSFGPVYSEMHADIRPTTLGRQY